MSDQPRNLFIYTFNTDFLWNVLVALLINIVFHLFFCNKREKIVDLMSWIACEQR